MTATLIISPDIDWSTKAQKNLLGQGFVCDIAHNGKDGQLKAYHTNYEFFFLDLEVKNNSGIEVVKYLRSSKPQAHVFVTISSPEILEALLLSEKSLLKMGVKKVLFEAPFDSLSEHIKGLGKIKTWESVQEVKEVQKDETESEIGDSEFSRIKINELYSNSIAIFDYFLRLKSNRYIKIIHKGEKPSVDQLRNYESNGAEYIYFKTKDREAFISYQNHLAKEAIKKPTPGSTAVYKMMKSATDKYLEEALTTGIRPALLEEGKAICQNMYDAAKSDAGLKKFLSDYEEFNPEEFSHSFLVSFFSTIICKNISWVGTKSLNTLALGALFHDIGVLQLPAEIRERDYELLTPEEKVLYKTHPVLGSEAMKSIPGMNSGVLLIIEQHQELVNGTGYPRGITGNNIYPLAKVVALADKFAYYVKEYGEAPKSALKGFVTNTDNLLHYDSELIKNLIKAF